MVTTEYFEDAKWQVRAVQDCKEDVEACKRSYTQLSLKNPPIDLLETLKSSVDDLKMLFSMVEFETEKHLPKKKVVETKFKERESDREAETLESQLQDQDSHSFPLT